jgi:PBP1b-binding outer membrane lipoprotein LpoB
VKRILVIVTAVLALALTGCSNMDSAASVGDEEIALTELQSQIDSIISERQKVDTSQMQLIEGEELTRNQLSFLISNIIINAIATEENIEITKSDSEAYRLEVIQNIGGEAALPTTLVSAQIAPEALDEVLKRDLILQRISEAASQAGADQNTVSELIRKLVTDKATELGIIINPRYGTWDAENFAIVPTDPAGDAVTND